MQKLLIPHFSQESPYTPNWKQIYAEAPYIHQQLKEAVELDSQQH